ncbi:aminodeoxychorismate lyase [Paenibacillus ginsengarvi]|uniref:4-amino-4-deoxychorismate lyase n=1 Tax=Paenibacillus ginsengarvi TaxID=400777 RepID=A0A3B0AYV1_9BACL|nr:aminodeoxychorismate lyase [Paenibacillus ginsengarvi]RKN65775.1 4-amino-4-deoxychorismate lyase [Paenibacillus ginsengarvi]
MKIAVNGSVCDEREAVISVYDHGFLYGLGLFETFRTYGGRPFLLERHLRRLAAGCEALGFRYAPSEDAAEALIASLLEVNGLPDAYIRLSVSAGVEALGLPAGDYDKPCEIVYVKPLPPRDETTYEKGKPVQRLKLPRNSPEGEYRFKSFHYMNNIMAKREMLGYGWAAGAEGLFLDRFGHVAEGIVSNVFWIKDGVLHTPSLETGILPGITREFVIETAMCAGLEVREGLYPWSMLLDADEAFLTGSVQEIVPVCSAFGLSGEKRLIGPGKPGPMTRQLMQQYAEAIGHHQAP